MLLFHNILQLFYIPIDYIVYNYIMYTAIIVCMPKGSFELDTYVPWKSEAGIVDNT